jgi:hypothetical protein
MVRLWQSITSRLPMVDADRVHRRAAADSHGVATAMAALQIDRGDLEDVYGMGVNVCLHIYANATSWFPIFRRWESEYSQPLFFISTQLQI